MRIAIIGSGIASISCAYYLKQKGHEITLFEAADYFGGHTHTHEIEVDGETQIVDTGFLVHNDRTYPNLIDFFEEIGIETYPSEMTFSVQNLEENLEWGGDSLNTLFAQRKNLFRPKFYRMIRDILHFNRNATHYLSDPQLKMMSLGELLKRQGYSKEFQYWYLLPMGGCIWSTPVEKMLDFPAFTFIQFCLNHGLLQITDRPQWKTIKKGCDTYTKKVLSMLDKTKKNTPITGVAKGENGTVTLRTTDNAYTFDKVVVGAHPPQVIPMLNEGFEETKKVLSAFKYQKNDAFLHTDDSILPRERKVWSAWNYTAGVSAIGERCVSVSYLLNHLLPLSTKTPVIVTLNPVENIAEEKIVKQLCYEHPLFDMSAIRAQEHIMELQGRHGVYFVGAWQRYGFHEDGIWSAKRVAEIL